jgi:hypothetical protein
VSSVMSLLGGVVIASVAVAASALSQLLSHILGLRPPDALLDPPKASSS